MVVGGLFYGIRYRREVMEVEEGCFIGNRFPT